MGDVGWNLGDANPLNFDPRSFFSFLPFSFFSFRLPSVAPPSLQRLVWAFPVMSLAEASSHCVAFSQPFLVFVGAMIAQQRPAIIDEQTFSYFFGALKIVFHEPHAFRTQHSCTRRMRSLASPKCRVVYLMVQRLLLRDMIRLTCGSVNDTSCIDLHSNTIVKFLAE